MAISTKTESLNGLKAMGATVKDRNNVALGAQSYRYSEYFTALAGGTVNYPCTVAVQDHGKQKGFETLALMGGSPVDQFKIIHFLLHFQKAGNASYKTKEPDVVTMDDHYKQALAAFAANGGWAVVNHGKVELLEPEPAVEFTFEGITYIASVYPYAVQLLL